MRGADLSGVRKILLEIHRQVIGEDGVKSLFRVLEDKGFLPDYHFSKETVVLFRNCQN